MASFFQAPVANSKKLVTVDQATSGANANVAITLITPALKRNYAVLIVWSYDGTPTTGRLTISGLDAASDTIDLDIRAAGPAPFQLPPVASAVGTDLVITLHAGGGGIIGKLNVFSVQTSGW